MENNGKVICTKYTKMCVSVHIMKKKDIYQIAEQ